MSWLIFVNGLVFCQSRSDISKEQQKIKKEIELIDNLIKSTSVKKNESLLGLNLINKKIDFKSEFIKNTKRDIELLESEIEENNDLIESLKNDLRIVKDEYARLIYNAYVKRRKESFLIYILSAGNFNQAYKRMKYLQLYNAYKKRQVSLIVAYNRVIQKKNEEIGIKIEEKEFIVKNLNNDLRNIQVEKLKQNDVYKSLQKRERDLKKEIDEKKSTARKLENEIAKIIAKERVKDKNKSLYEMLTPEEKIISGDFAANKGRLPWPIDRGIITGKFGIHDHPVLKNVKIRNDGIYLSTVAGSDVKCVYKGVVSKIFSLPGSNFAVIVKHGNYFSLYNNLISVAVKEGDMVDIKQKIGTVFTDFEKGESILHFQIWKEMEKNNPESWLTR
ncbi:MAG: peptidoglycan DD-metalloendopeptidase family protein [Bacteroidales bacterium]